MSKQNYEQKNESIRKQFIALKKQQPKKLKHRLNLSWSNWGFGIEPLAELGPDFAAFIQRDFARSQELLRIANFQPE